MNKQRIASCGCGCNPDQGRKAAGVDPELKTANLTRLKRIEGQIRGVARMVEEDRYCADVITQITAVQEALRSVSRNLLRNHLSHCAATAIRKGSDEADSMYDELVDLMFKSAR